MRWVAFTVAVLVAAACNGTDEGETVEPDAVRIAAFDFPESELLAELYAQVLEADGIPVDRLGVVGPREIVAPALQLDRIDLVPEYLGTAADHYGADAADLDALRAALEPLGLVALEPSSAEDVNVVVVTRETAARDDLVTVSDLVDVAPSARFGGPVECPDRPLCLLGLRDTYGLEFAEFVPQRSLERTADALRRGEIEVGMMFSTSAALSDGSLVVLEDDRALQPPEDIVPVVRGESLERWAPEARRALDALSSRLTTDGLRELNRRVEADEAVDAVARSWLQQAGSTGG